MNPPVEKSWVPLTPRERRVLGVLVEKAKTTPEYYPLTIAAIVTGSNQKSNRDPVTSYDADDVEEILQGLRKKGAVVMVEGSGRVVRWKHTLYDWLKVTKVELAVIAELLLRGSQSEGDLRQRASRMEPLPDLASLVRTINDAHTDARPVAVHCVTRVQTVLTLSALGVAGVHRGDRIEHASVVPAELLAHLAGLGVTVVTNPGLVRSRGDRYLREVDRGDRGDLYRCRSLALAGVSVAAGTDAPFGPEDPWTVMATAVERRTADGAPLGPDEAIPPDEALGLFLGEPEAPGRRRRVVVGARADLCVLGVPGGEMRRVLRAGETGCGTPLRSADVVAACVAGGRIVAERR